MERLKSESAYDNKLTLGNKSFKVKGLFKHNSSTTDQEI